VKKTGAQSNRGARRKVPVDVRDLVLMEAGYQCAVPTCRTLLLLDVHHITRVADDGGDEPSNLIALCPNHHDMHHRGTIPAGAIRAWKQMLVALNAAFDRESIALLLFLSVQEPGARPLEISGDGVLRFAHLIAAGFAAFEQFTSYQESSMGYMMRLTPKGQNVVAAWKDGEPEQLEVALARPPV